MSVVGYLRDVSEPENYFEVYAGRVTVGRADSNDIKIASRSVSSNHAEIEIEPSARPPKMLVTDLGSRNATFVNDVRLLGSSRAISWNDAIRFGYDTVTYRLVQELEEQQGSPPRKEDKVPPHERPPAGMPSVAEGQMNRTAMSSMSPQRGMKKTSKNTFSELAVEDGGHRGRSADDALGSPPRGRVADYDGIGFPRDEKGSDRDERGGGRGAHKPDERDRDGRDGREKDFGRARDRDGELEREEPRRSGRDPYQDRGGDDRSEDKGGARRVRGGPRETAKSDPEYEDEYAGERRSGSGIGRGRVGGEGDTRHEAGELEGRSDGSRRRGGGGLPAPDIPGGDINYLLQEEERRLAEELNKRRADLGAGQFEGGGMDMAAREPPVGSIADMQRQINALVTELALKERQLGEVSVDDLARCLMDTQQTKHQLSSALKSKDDELGRMKLQLKQLNAGNNDAWDKIVADASSECIRLRREVDEWKSRDTEAARRWSEQQEQVAAYGARIAELETLIARQRDAAEEDAVSRDTEIRAMNKRMHEIAGANEPSKLQAAKFLVDQVTEQEKAMRVQKEHAMQLETRMLELKREAEYLRNLLHSYGADDGDKWQDGAIQRLSDQLTELRAQGGVQRVVEAEEALARALVEVEAKESDHVARAPSSTPPKAAAPSKAVADAGSWGGQVELEGKEMHLVALSAQHRRNEVLQESAQDRGVMEEQVKAKERRINQLEEAKYRLEEENTAMARKLEELQRKDALNRAKSSKSSQSAGGRGALSYPADPFATNAGDD